MIWKMTLGFTVEWAPISSSFYSLSHTRTEPPLYRLFFCKASAHSSSYVVHLVLLLFHKQGWKKNRFYTGGGENHSARTKMSWEKRRVFGLSLSGWLLNNRCSFGCGGGAACLEKSRGNTALSLSASRNRHWSRELSSLFVKYYAPSSRHFDGHESKILLSKLFSLVNYLTIFLWKGWC